MHARRLDLGISLLVAVSWTMLLGAVPAAADEAPGGEIDLHVALDFRLDDGTDLLSVGDAATRNLLTPVQGRGARFGPRQKERYCRPKKPSCVQWAVNDLFTGEVLAQSPNAP